jgi:hypothetical protein
MMTPNFMIQFKHSILQEQAIIPRTFAQVYSEGNRPQATGRSKG